jgi:hypothetical protein
VVLTALTTFANFIQLNAATPLPVVHGPLPVAADSHPFGAADHTRVPTDLKKTGYVEKEFLADGKTNIYEWPEQGPAVHIRRIGGICKSRSVSEPAWFPIKCYL